MRLDKFLFFTRLTKTRSLAQKIAHEGHVRINGQPTDKPHITVSLGMVVTLPLNDHIRIFRIEMLPTRRGPFTEARACYTELTDGADRTNPNHNEY
jgi:ribosome-associated heat shock protein Hsp15